MNKRANSRRIGAAALLLIVSACGVAAQSKDEAQIEILAIRGTTKNTEVSAELKDIAPTLQNSLKLTGLKLEKPAFSGTATAKKPHETDLVAGYKSKITFVERKENRIKIKIEVTRPAPPGDKKEKGDKDKKDDKGKKDEKKKDGEKPAGNAAPDVFATTITIDAGGRQNFEFDYPGGGGDKLILSISAK